MATRSKTIRLPDIDVSSPTKPVPSPLRTRGRSSSIVKVEQVGERYIDEALDRSAFVNINANWVNAKGAFLLRVCVSQD